MARIESHDAWLTEPSIHDLINDVRGAMNEVKNGDGENRYIMLVVAVAKLNEIQHRLLKEKA